MMPAADSAAVVRRETIVSAAINAVLSAAFFVGVFGLAGAIPVRGIGKLAFDFLPQSAAIGLMASLMPGMIVRRAMTTGKIVVPAAAPTTGQVVIRAVGGALVALALGALLGAMLWSFGPDVVARPAAFSGKVLYGAVIGSCITRFQLQRMLR